MTTQFRHMKQVLVASSIAFLTLAGCESDSDSDSSSSSTPTGFLGTTTLTGTTLAADNEPFDDALISDRTEGRNAFRVTETTIDEGRNRITVIITGQTGNTETALDDTTLDDSDIDDAPGDDIIPDGGNLVATATLTFELSDDIEDGETSLLGTENAPEWTIVRGTDNIFYRNRARRVANDHTPSNPSPLEQDDANYVEYHAMTYVGATPAATATNPNPIPPEIVRVEVVLIPNYDDSQAATTEREDGEDNENNLLDENIALGLRFDPASRTQANASNLPSGRVSYTGRYMGQNRFTFTNTAAAFDPDGTGNNVDPIGTNTAIVAKEANAPRMTITATFTDTQRNNEDNPPVSFTIHEAELTVDDTVGNVEVDGTMTVEIRGTAQLTQASDLEFDNGRITNVNGVNLPLTFTQGTNTATLTLNPGNLTTDAAGEGNFVATNNNVIGMFFNRSTAAADVAAADVAAAVAGLIDFEAGVDHTQSISGEDDVVFTVTHEMLGVFLAERDLR